MVRTNGWPYGHVITKISRMGRLPVFLGMGLHSRASSSAMNVFPVIIQFCRRWAGFSVVLGSTGCRVRAAGANFGGIPRYIPAGIFKELDSLKYNFQDRNWLTGKVFKVLKCSQR